MRRFSTEPVGLECLDDGLGDVLGGLEIDLEMEVADAGGGGGADGGDAGAADVAGVVVELEEEAEEGVDAIGAGENDPIVAVGILDELAELEEVGGLLDADGGDLPDIGAEGAKAGGKRAGLFAGAGDDDALAEEGAGFEPVEGVAQLDDLAEDGDGRGGEAGFGDEGGDGIEPAPEGLLAAGGGPADEGDGEGGVGAVGEQGLGDGGDALDAHEHDLGAGLAGDGGVIEGGAGL